MPGGLTLKIETEYITAPIPPPSTKYERFASLRGSEKLTGDDSLNKQRVRTALGQRHVHQPNVDPSGGYSRLKTAHSRISVDVQPFLKSLQPQKVSRRRIVRRSNHSYRSTLMNSSHAKAKRRRFSTVPPMMMTSTLVITRMTGTLTVPMIDDFVALPYLSQKQDCCPPIQQHSVYLSAVNGSRRLITCHTDEPSTVGNQRLFPVLSNSSPISHRASACSIVRG